MNWDCDSTNLLDESCFQAINGLWTGKKPPYQTASVIRNTNFTQSGRIDYSDVAVLQVEQKQLAKKRLYRGDIIVERSGGGPKQPVGRVVYFDREDGTFAFSNFTSAIRVLDSSTYDSKFVLYRLLEIYQSGQTEDLQRRTTGIRNLDFNGYRERVEIPKIPIDEQRKIAGVLGLVQRAIEQQERLLALTAELKKTLLHQLFTQGLHGESQKETEIGLVPESWNVVTLSELCELIIDCPHTTPKFKTEGMRVVRNYNIRDGAFVNEPAYYTSDAEYRTRTARAIPLPGDILFSREAPVGEACVIPGGMRVSLGQRTMVLRTNHKALNASFMVHNFYSPIVRSKMLATASGLTVAHLNVSDVRAMLVPVPPLEDQIAIAKCLDAAADKLRVHRSKQASLKTLFHTLLHQLMTAQVRIIDMAALDS